MIWSGMPFVYIYQHVQSFCYPSSILTDMDVLSRVTVRQTISAAIHFRTPFNSTLGNLLVIRIDPSVTSLPRLLLRSKDILNIDEHLVSAALYKQCLQFR